MEKLRKLSLIKYLHLPLTIDQFYEADIKTFLDGETEALSCPQKGNF